MTYSGKTLLITGGTGSFGGTVLEHLSKLDFAEIRVFSRDEKKQDDMRRRLANPSLSFHIGDVRDRDAVQAAMRGVDHVFHAAALKQVPSCEFYPMEAVKTNVMGTQNVLLAAAAQNVSRVVCLSTDKAVYPINAMGISKALMEKVMVAESRNAPEGTVFTGTRYGNVMMSRGSVIPLFMEQIRQNKPLTLTDPEMTRFMMSLDDAVELVLYAFEHGQSGDLYIQKSPSATIEVLAEAVKRLMGAPDHPVKVIGTRHGEKVYETLLSREERTSCIDQGRYFRVPADARDLNYGKFFDDGDQEISESTDYNSHNSERLTVEQTIQLLEQLPLFQAALAGGCLDHADCLGNGCKWLYRQQLDAPSWCET
ncbi:polysaccharide biosynthesis protein [Devosia sp. J2-20]|uniref:polysaccharide biosynthesis protein n=1 Tax=Devosia sp. J2-20 TaxID=3026161 RepID=UPI002499AF44|nr:polysaccharide biosynthesis protein [Devosia sp. J2-20]WDR00460.1 polysaccharide biosynthesis protein [Devosia sp. J2-20]